jgi:tRNA pseudouridine55 synthase
VRDLGRALGTRAVLTSLRRTRVGNFRICDAVTLDAVKDLVNKDEAVAVLQPLPAALDDIPVIAGDADAAARLRRGQEALVHPSKASHTEATGAETLGPVMVLEGSTPVAMADVVEGGAGPLRLRPIRVFNMV